MKKLIGLLASLALVAVCAAENVEHNMNFQGEVNFDNGSRIKLKGTEMTSTASQLNTAGSTASYTPNVIGSISGSGGSASAALAGTNYIAITLKDLTGTAMATQSMCRVWLSGTKFSTPSTGTTVAAVSAVTGTIVQATTLGTTNCDLWILSNPAGLITLRTVSNQGAYTNFCHICAGGYVYPITCACTNYP